jgi:hypothetical protein
MSKAGIVVYNSDNDSLLIGTGSVYSFGFATKSDKLGRLINDKSVGYLRPLTEFINELDALGIFGVGGQVMANFQQKFDTDNGNGAADTLLAQVDNMIPVLSAPNSDPLQFILQYILNEQFINSAYEQYHIVNNMKEFSGVYVPTSCQIRIPNNSVGIPKGDIRPTELRHPHIGALREF